MTKPVIGFSLDPADVHRIDDARRKFAPAPIPTRSAFCRAAVLMYLDQREAEAATLQRVDQPVQPHPATARCSKCGDKIAAGATRCADCGG